MGNAGSAREGEDRDQAVQYFGLLGWRGEGEDAITDARLSALLARSRAYKTELDGWKERNRCETGAQQARAQGAPRRVVPAPGSWEDQSA